MNWLKSRIPYRFLYFFTKFKLQNIQRFFLAATVIRRKLYRVSCKKVYQTLKVNIQRFLSTKIIKNIQILHLNKYNNYQLIITSFFH